MTIVLNGTTGITTPGTDSTTLVVNSNNISAVNSLGFRNRIINGAMVIDQRNAGAQISADNTVFGVDRFQMLASVSSKLNVQQNAGSVTPPAGFSNYLGFTSTSAYSVGASEIFAVNQKIEGFNTADLAWGTASAQSVTLSFWVRSSLTGTFSGMLFNSAANRSYVFSYTISAANTWEQKSVTIAGDTTGTWLTNNGIGIRVFWTLAAGSSMTGSAGSWVASDKYGVTGTTSVVGTNGATFYITGVQLEAGSVASPFERRDYGRELMMCQRYYRKSFNQATAPAQNAGLVGAVFFKSAASGAGPYGHVSFSTAMRTTPSTITTFNPSAANANWRNTTAGSDLNAEVANAGESGVGIGSNTQTMNQYALASIQYTAEAEL